MAILRARERITSHFRIPSSGHLEPIFTRKILNVGFATPAVLLRQIGSRWPKSGREFLAVILSRALSLPPPCPPGLPLSQRERTKAFGFRELEKGLS